MRYTLFLMSTAFMYQVATAQSGTASLSASEGSVTTSVTDSSAIAAAPPAATAAAGNPSSRMAILDYKSVYEAPTVEEEVKMAAERFNLTQSQQDVWLEAATDRRITERQAREKLDTNTNQASYSRDDVYRGLRMSQNTFYEKVTGYLTPTQKQAFENDRLILNEKQKKLAKLPPPPPPAPVDTLAPVDSTMIKEPESGKGKDKKSKKKG